MVGMTTLLRTVYLSLFQLKTSKVYTLADYTYKYFVTDAFLFLRKTPIKRSII